jgi:uncharacterized protein (DUF2461 family)
MAENHDEYRAMVKKILKTRAMGMTNIDSNALTRMPKGFASDHPADELLRARNWGVHAYLPVEAALKPSFGNEIVKRFRLVAPLIASLNEAIEAGEKRGGMKFEAFY